MKEVIGRLNELQEKQDLTEDEIKEIETAPEKLISSLKENNSQFALSIIKGIDRWYENTRRKNIKDAVRGFACLFNKEEITDEQLSAAIRMDTATVEYLETRMGPNIFTAGLVLELRSLIAEQEQREAPKGD